MSAFRPPRDRSRCSASAFSKPARSTRTPYSAASSTVRSIGKPYVSCSRKATSPGSTGESGPTPPRTPDDSLGRRERNERLLELDDAGVERPRELALLRGDDAVDLRAPLLEVRIRDLHRVDDDARQVRQERLLAAEQPAVAHGAAQELAKDVAAASFVGLTPSGTRKVRARMWSAMTW